MNISGFKYLKVLVLLFSLLLTAKPQDSARPSQKNGTLVVLVTQGDLYHTPAADNVYIEAFGFVEKYRSKKSFVLQFVKPGHYEASLPPGVYDVFVSEGTSEPRCRRVLIKPGLTGYWTLQLELDEIYTEK